MIFILLFILLICSLVDAFILKVIIKNKALLKITYKKSLFFSVIIKAVILLSVLAIINTDGYLVIIIPVLLGLLVSFFLFRKYFNIGADKSFIVSIYYLASVLLVCAAPYAVRFGRELYLQAFSPYSISDVCGGRVANKVICEPSLICEYQSCGDSGCLALPHCGVK